VAGEIGRQLVDGGCRAKVRVKPHTASQGIDRSANRTNRVLRAPATRTIEKPQATSMLWLGFFVSLARRSKFHLNKINGLAFGPKSPATRAFSDPMDSENALSLCSD
jgi:hypothetical protein